VLGVQQAHEGGGKATVKGEQKNIYGLENHAKRGKWREIENKRGCLQSGD